MTTSVRASASAPAARAARHSMVGARGASDAMALVRSRKLRRDNMDMLLRVVVASALQCAARLSEVRLRMRQKASQGGWKLLRPRLGFGSGERLCDRIFERLAPQGFSNAADDF